MATNATTMMNFTTPAPVYNLTDDISAYIDTRIAEADQAWSQMLGAEYNATYAAASDNARDMDIAWLIVCGALVFFMQCGFAMLEAGIVHPKNVTNILFKNMIDASVAALSFWIVGWALAYGEDGQGFIGTTYFATSDIYNGAGAGGTDGWENWFFQWAFTAAAATIVAGSVAERTKLEAYFCYSIVLTSLIYPVVVHWGWGSGWLSAWGAYPDANGVAQPLLNKDETSNGMIDFAGSGIVHAVGGFSGLMGALVVGPRKGRFLEDGTPATLHDGNKTLQSLGVFILWFGWYGFNCGSTLALSGGAANVAGKVAMTTTISAGVACIVATLIAKVTEGNFDVSMGLNGILAGLVSITANCSIVEPWMAVIIGAVGAIVLHAGHNLLLYWKIDDPCDACIIHGFCGVWGLWAVGLFCTDANVQYAAYPNVNTACATGEQMAVQVIGSIAIVAWTCAMAGTLFLVVSITIGMRVSEEVEDAGLDTSEHGLAPYPLFDTGADEEESDDEEGEKVAGDDFGNAKHVPMEGEDETVVRPFEDPVRKPRSSKKKATAMPTKGRRSSLEVVALSDEEPLSDSEAHTFDSAPRATTAFPVPEAPPGSPDTEYASLRATPAGAWN